MLKLLSKIPNLFLAVLLLWYIQFTEAFNKTRCLCRMSFYQYLNLTCPFDNLVIDVTNAFLFDDKLNGLNNKTCNEPLTSNIISYQAYDLIRSRCNGLINCSVPQPILYEQFENTSKIVCLGVKVNWDCIKRTYETRPTYTNPYNTWNRVFLGFTYFFYVITLVISTSCIIIGALFVLRRFLVLRRLAQERSRDQTGPEYNIWTASNPNFMIDDMRPPPAYENIYESSSPINPPPDYSLVQLIKQKSEAQKEANLQPPQAIPMQHLSAVTITQENIETPVQNENVDNNANDNQTAEHNSNVQMNGSEDCMHTTKTYDESYEELKK